MKHCKRILKAHAAQYGYDYNKLVNDFQSESKENQDLFLMQIGGINPANKGLFTKKAQRQGMGVQEYAHHVMVNSNNPKLRKQANFAINAKKWHHQNGGEIDDVSLYGYRDDSPYNENPYNVINSNYITMNETGKPLVGISNTGDVQYMNPYSGDYQYDGEYVTEYPIEYAQIGSTSLDNFRKVKLYNTYFAGEDTIKNNNGNVGLNKEQNERLNKRIEEATRVYNQKAAKSNKRTISPSEMWELAKKSDNIADMIFTAPSKLFDKGVETINNANNATKKLSNYAKPYVEKAFKTGDTIIKDIKRDVKYLGDPIIKDIKRDVKYLGNNINGYGNETGYSFGTNEDYSNVIPNQNNYTKLKNSNNKGFSFGTNNDYSYSDPMEGSLPSNYTSSNKKQKGYTLTDGYFQDYSLGTGEGLPPINKKTFEVKRSTPISNYMGSKNAMGDYEDYSNLESTPVKPKQTKYSGWKPREIIYNGEKHTLAQNPDGTYSDGQGRLWKVTDPTQHKMVEITPKKSLPITQPKKQVVKQDPKQIAKTKVSSIPVTTPKQNNNPFLTPEQPFNEQDLEDAKSIWTQNHPIDNTTLREQSSEIIKELPSYVTTPTKELPKTAAEEMEKAQKLKFRFNNPMAHFANTNALLNAYSPKALPFMENYNEEATMSPLIDDRPFIQAARDQFSFIKRNINPNSTVGASFMADMVGKESETINKIQNDIASKNIQIQAQNNQNYTNALNNNRYKNMLAKEKYYDDYLQTTANQKLAQQSVLNDLAQNYGEQIKLDNSMNMWDANNEYVNFENNPLNFIRGTKTVNIKTPKFKVSKYDDSKPEFVQTEDGMYQYDKDKKEYKKIEVKKLGGLVNKKLKIKNTI